MQDETPTAAVVRIMQELIARAEQAGSHFFSRDAMRFFSSRISTMSLTRLDDDTFRFITSERYPYEGAPRLYTVREVRFSRDEDGHEHCRIDAVAGGVQAYPSLSAARRHLADGVA